MATSDEEANDPAKQLRKLLLNTLDEKHEQFKLLENKLLDLKNVRNQLNDDLKLKGKCIVCRENEVLN